MFKGQLLIFVIIYIRSSLCYLGVVYETGKEIWKLHLMVDNRTSLSDSYNMFPLCINQMELIHEELQKMENSMSSKTIRNAFEAQPYPIMLYKALDSLELFTLTIEQYYDEFRKIIDKSRYYSEELGYFMRQVIPDIEEKIQTIRRQVLQPIESLGQNMILAITAYAASEQPNLCHSRRIISDVLFQLFKMIVIVEMKAHVMSAAAKSYISPQNDASGRIDHFSPKTLGIQIGRYVHLFSLNIPTTDAVYLKACEPHSHWIRDESFYELEGIFQTAIFSYDWKKCYANTCHDKWYNEPGKCEAQFYDDRTSCPGKMSKCINLDGIEACVLKRGLHKFHHVNSTVHGVLGSHSTCPSFNTYIIEDGTDHNSSHSACACNCYGKNDNKISLVLMESNVTSNMVITGLRFVRHRQILHIQPREGKLCADGRIRRYSERWISIPKNIPESQIHSINTENGVFFLDDLRLPSSFVLTGIKFNLVQRLSVIGFAIEIFGAPFNFESGELNSNRNIAVSKQASNNVLGKPLIFEAVSSALASSPLTPSPADKKYVSLERSNLKDDFGQSTLPLFDAIPVVTNPSLPLRAIGIFHKGANGYAGFISLRIYGMKYAHFFTDFQATYMKNNTVIFNETQ